MTGPWRICHIHTPNKGLMLPKVLTRTSLKMSATVAPMGLQNTASCGWQEESQPSSLSFILLNKSAIPAHEGIQYSQAMLPPTLCPFPSPVSPSPSFLSSLCFSLSVLSYFSPAFWGRGCGVVYGITLNLGGLSLTASTCFDGLDEWQAGQGGLASHLNTSVL